MSSVSSRYQIVKTLAEGGMGEILLARRQGPAGFTKLVVLKRPLSGAARSPVLVRALIAEARLLARINHPNVCQVFDLEEADGEFFLSMEFLQGLSLWEILVHAAKTGTPIEPRILCGIFEQVCHGLGAIHGLHADGSLEVVVHRDISPGNLFVVERGIVKILDLGIAKSTASEERTPFGRVKGKLAYVSPEQVSGQPFDARADLFALGLVLYDLVRGIRPPPDRIGALAVDSLALDAIPVSIAAVIRRATASSPDGRFASAAEMGAALRAAGAELGTAVGQDELAAWLAQRFDLELGARSAQMREALEGLVIEADTQILLARSALPTPSDEPEPPSIPTRETEQLAVSDVEREAPSAESPARRRRLHPILILGGMVAVSAALMVAVASGFHTEDVGAAAPVRADASIASASPVIVPLPIPIAPITGSASPVPTPDPPTKPATIRRRAPVADGLLTVGSTPYAEVWLGTRSLGPTTVWKIPVPPGSYKLHAELGDGRTQDVVVKIGSGKLQVVRLDWSKH